MNISYFDKMDYLCERTLNVIDQIYFIEHYQDLSEYISENYIELKPDSFYLEDNIKSVNWGLKDLAKAKKLGSEQNKGIAGIWNWIKKSFHTILGSVLAFFGKLVNVIIHIINNRTKTDWNKIKEEWANYENRNITEAELSDEAKDQAKKVQEKEDNIKNATTADPDAKSADDASGNINLNNVYFKNNNYDSFTEAEGGFFKNILSALPICQKKVESNILPSIEILIDNGLMIHTVMGVIALKAYVNAILNLVNPSIKSRLKEKYDIQAAGKTVNISYEDILNFFNLDYQMNNICQYYNQFCTNLDKNKMYRYIDALDLKRVGLDVVEKIDAKTKEQINVDIQAIPQIIDNLAERSRTFAELLKRYLYTIEEKITNNYGYKNQYQQTKSTLSLTNKDEDPGYYSSKDNALDPNLITAIYGISKDKNENTEMLVYLPDIELIKFTNNTNEARQNISILQKKISNMTNGKKDVEEELNARIKHLQDVNRTLTNPFGMSVADTKPAKRIADFIRKTIQETKYFNKISKYKNMYIDLYETTTDLMGMIKAKHQLMTNKITNNKILN